MVTVVSNSNSVTRHK